jgi:hypothetical protein
MKRWAGGAYKAEMGRLGGFGPQAGLFLLFFFKISVFFSYFRSNLKLITYLELPF